MKQLLRVIPTVLFLAGLTFGQSPPRDKRGEMLDAITKAVAVVEAPLTSYDAIVKKQNRDRAKFNKKHHAGPLSNPLTAEAYRPSQIKAIMEQHAESVKLNAMTLQYPDPPWIIDAAGLTVYHPTNPAYELQWSWRQYAGETVIGGNTVPLFRTAPLSPAAVESLLETLRAWQAFLAGGNVPTNATP